MKANATNTEVVEVVFSKDVVVAMVAAVAVVAIVALVDMVAVMLDTLVFNTNSSFVCNT